MNGNSNIQRHHIKKPVHEGKCIALSIYIKKKKSQINLTFYFKKLGKAQTKPKTRSKEIKTRA